VQFSGMFLRMESAALEEAKMRSLTLRHLFARYADCMVAQIFQAVACNGAHTIEQRTAKWLQAALVRTGTDEVPLTQEQLAAMLGVGRSYISRVIRSLKQKGVLETKRGRLRVRDLDALNNLACRCNDAVKRHFEEVLSGVYPVEDEGTALRTLDAAE
jgi:CRP-like cAMP-binding protein